ncbi:hypothetical protein HID58_068819 [Brassica napus]|uniref:Uncharacterized protein n=1 Tax=Brassica napus TaxID=3708 RepID=A0ABQ7ZN17_BRANA|nr:hypothetical protein HID58_068819 [Brassica napus]
MENPSDKVVVKWVNDTRGRVCWVILASLCLCGFTQLMEVFKDESQVIYKYVGMSLVSLYVILLVKSLCSDETPTIGYRSGSCLRSFVPLLSSNNVIMVIITLGISVAYDVVAYDLDEIMPFGFIFSYIFMCEMIIGVINYPGNHRFFNRY